MKNESAMNMNALVFFWYVFIEVKENVLWNLSLSLVRPERVFFVMSDIIDQINVLERFDQHCQNQTMAGAVAGAAVEDRKDKKGKKAEEVELYNMSFVVDY